MSEKKLKKTEEYKTNRVLVMFGVAALYLWVLSFLHKCIDNPMQRTTGIVLVIVLFGLSVAGVVASLIWHMKSLRQETKPSVKKTFSGLFCVFLTALLAVCCGLIWYNHLLGMRVVYLLVPASAILYLIYSAYQRECFTLCAGQCAVAFVLYALSGRVFGFGMILRVIALLVGLAVVALLLMGFRAAKDGKKVNVLGVAVQLFAKTTCRYLVLGTCAADAVLLAAAFFLGGAIAMYIAFAVLLSALALLVYYTVKLM